MVHARFSNEKRAVLTATLLALCGLQASAQQDPPSRVARLNHTEGNVSMEPAGFDDWTPAQVNRPLTTGDYLYTDSGARAELHTDEAVLRMGQQTSFGFLNLNDQAVQIKLSEGDMYFRLHDLATDQVFEVDTPNAAVTLLRAGVYRFRVDPSGSMSFVVVRGGQAEVTSGGQAFTLNPGNSALISGTDQMAFDVETAPGPDDFDIWCQQRDEREAHRASARYLSPTVIGYEDLDDYGAWQDAPDYGAVWYPRAVAAGWAPYQAGHWAWVEPWGWTWVDDAPWGFAPFHYGRWAYIGGRWGWCPGPIAVGYRGPVERPYYAPALVAWFGGAHWGVSVSLGRPSVGWVALGVGEVFTPSYVCSRHYFTNVNVRNTRVVENVNITNVYNTVYVNHTVYNREFVNVRAPGAAVAMRQDAFASGRPVREGFLATRPADAGQWRGNSVLTPQVAPTRQSMMATAGRPAPRPAAQILSRQVIARTTPPAAPVAFAARQRYLTQHAGQAFDAQAMHQAVGVRATPAALVRQTPTARPMEVHAGEKVGNIAAGRGPTNPPGRFAERTAPAAGGSAAGGHTADRQAVFTERTQSPAAQRIQATAGPADRRTTAPDRQPMAAERTAPAAGGSAAGGHSADRQAVLTERTQSPAAQRTQTAGPADRRTAAPDRQPAAAERIQAAPRPAITERTQMQQTRPPAPERSHESNPEHGTTERTQSAPAERSQVRPAQPAPPPAPEHRAAVPAHEEHHQGEQHHAEQQKGDHKDTKK